MSGKPEAQGKRLLGMVENIGNVSIVCPGHDVHTENRDNDS